jgi:hypothetical protein
MVKSVPVLPGLEAGPKEGAHPARTLPVSINMRRFPENRHGHLGDRAKYDPEVVRQLGERNFGRFFCCDHLVACQDLQSRGNRSASQADGLLTITESGDQARSKRDQDVVSPFERATAVRDARLSSWLPASKRVQGENKPPHDASKDRASESSRNASP